MDLSGLPKEYASEVFSGDFFSALFEATATPLFVKDGAHRYVLVNDAFCQWDGRSKEELLGRSSLELYPEPEALLFMENDRKVLASEDVAVSEEDHTGKDGVIRIALTKKKSFRAPNGERFIVGTATDITERLRMERELEEARREAEQASHAKTEFLAAMSHEIRTPLNSVIGMSELLLSEDASPEERTEYLRMISAGGRGLLEIVTNILDFSKIESGRMELESAPFLLDDALSALDLFRFQCREKGIAFSIGKNTDVPARVIGDAVRVRQVLFNLAGNAVKFTHEGGVRVLVKRGSAYPGEILFSVEDTGIGISEDAMGRLFESFSQGDPSMTRKYGGTGLGLALSKRLVEAMGGTLRLESVQGRGSVFSFSLPLPEAPALPEGNILSAESGAFPGEGRTVLIAEDNTMNRVLVEKLFRAEGWRTIAVPDGLSAVRTVAERDVDLVVLDCQMPVMDGLEAARAIRRLERGARLPIMALTAHALSDYKVLCTEAGMDAFISKPVRRRILFDEVDRLMNASESAPAALADLDGLLRELQGDSKSLAELVQLFLEDLPGQTGALSDALEREDRKALRNAAHTLKGLLSNLGALKGVAAAEKIMKLAAEAPFAELASYVRYFERLLEETAGWLRERMS